MWIRRAISRLRYWYSQAYHPDHTGFSERLGHVRCLDTQLFLAKDNPSPYLYTLPVLWPSVETYNQKLRWLIYLLSTEAAVPNHWCNYDQIEEVTLYAFLLSNKGIHLDAVPTLVAFQENAVTFMHKLEALQDTAEAGSAGHNARVLKEFGLHLQTLFRALIHYTHHEQTQ